MYEGLGCSSLQKFFQSEPSLALGLGVFRLGGAEHEV